MRRILTTTCLGVTLGLALGAAPAMAQPYDNGGGYDSAYDGRYAPPPATPEEELEVTAPPYQEWQQERRRLGTGPSKVMLSERVPAGDLDLTTKHGAYELKARIRNAAWHICDQLVAEYPHREPGTQDCYRQTLDNGLVHADRAITIARQNARYRAARYDEGYNGY